MIIIFEGPDASGKDFLRERFEKNNSYEHVCITRFFLSQLVYAIYFGRMNKDLIDSYVHDAQKFFREFNPLVVLTFATDQTLKNRIIQRGENPLKQPDSKFILSLYDFWIEKLKISNNILYLDTSEDLYYEIAIRMIEEKIKSMENTNGKRIKNARVKAPTGHGRPSPIHGNTSGLKHRR